MEQELDRLSFGLKKICERNRDGSFVTQSNRFKQLLMFSKQLKEAGYKTNQMRPSDFKGRHVNALLKRWNDEGLSTGTIKNRMATLRWWADKVGKSDMIKSNDTYNIEKREYITNQNKSKNLSNIDMSKITSEYVKNSLQLQSNFGLRREESMKFNARFALEGMPPKIGGVVKIKPQWSKGGRYREITIVNESQVKALENVIKFVGYDNSLIPVDKSYKQHKGLFERQTSSAGIGQTHGLRHKFAQDRYKNLTGFDCPIIAGVRELSEAEKNIDKEARQIISNELGHNRLAITGVYLGSWGRQ